MSGQPAITERGVDAAVVARSAVRRWWLVGLVVLLGAAVGALVTARSAPEYSAHVTFFVGSAETQDSALTADEAAKDRNHTFAVLMSRSVLARRIVAAQHLHITPETVAREVTGRAQADTVLLDVTVLDPSQRRALAIAKGVASEAPRLVASLDASSASSDTAANTSSFTVTSGPRVSSRPQAHTRLGALLGGLGGLLAGLGLAVLAEVRDHRVRSAAALAQAAGAPVLGAVSFDPAFGPDGAANEAIGPGPAEELRQLRTAVQFLSFARTGSVLTFAATAPGDGASTVVAHLARTVAQAGRRVCVVDANLRNPAQARAFGLGPGDGLSSVLTGRASLGSIVHRVVDGLDVVPSGPRPPNPSELLDAAGLPEALSQLRPAYDLVLVDGAPVLPFADSAVVGRRCDGVVLVARYGRTSVSSVDSAAHALRTAGASLAGVVLTMAPATGDRYAAYAPDPVVR